MEKLHDFGIGGGYILCPNRVCIRHVEWEWMGWDEGHVNGCRLFATITDFQHGRILNPFTRLGDAAIDGFIGFINDIVAWQLEPPFSMGLITAGAGDNLSGIVYVVNMLGPILNWGQVYI